MTYRGGLDKVLFVRCKQELLDALDVRRDQLAQTTGANPSRLDVARELLELALANAGRESPAGAQA